MKTIVKALLFGATLMGCLTNCSDFLEESSQDEIKPTTVDDLAAVLYSEAYPYNFTSDNYLILLTDEVQCNGVKHTNYTERFKQGEPIFCFDKEMADGNKSFIEDENSWKNWYKLIMGCNVVLDNVDNMSGNATDKQHIKGQAMLLRAYYYMRLAMVYAQPYRIDPDKNLGVTLITTSRVNDTEPARSTVKQTYRFIEEELIKASELLRDFVPTTKYRVQKTMADILLARLYLYEENWDKAIEYAGIAIQEGPALTDFNNLVAMANIFVTSYSSEVVWNYSGRYSYAPYFGTNTLQAGMLPYSLSASTQALYDQANDLRYQKYISASTYYGSYVKKIEYSTQYDGERGIRMAEAYLTRAEAYAAKGLAKQALADLNTLRANRFTKAAYTPLTEAEVADVKQAVLDERQREYVWEEGLRWMDIKRHGLSVSHTFIDEEGVQTIYTLAKDDALYALPIPYDAIARNKNLIQNPR